MQLILDHGATGQRRLEFHVQDATLIATKAIKKPTGREEMTERLSNADFRHNVAISDVPPTTARTNAFRIPCKTARLPLGIMQSEPLL